MSTKNKAILFLAIACLAVFAFSKIAVAADAQNLVMHIDQGFLGHPVKLDLLGGSARLAWQAGEVLRPSDINIGVSTSSELNVIWSTSYVLGGQGVELGLKPSFAATSTDKWHDIVMETKTPFGKWQRQPVVMKDGYLTARVGPEVQARLVVVAKGMRVGTASWYSYKKCLCAASPDFPAGTKLKVALKSDPSKFVVIKVNDYGPDRKLFPNRVIDLDSTAFKILSPLSAGKVEVTVDPVTEIAAATSAATSTVLSLK